MTSTLPPSYEPASTAPPTLLLNITPKPHAIEFQSGFLGVTKSSLAGEVQIKDVNSNAATLYKSVELRFLGVERVQGGQGSEVELTAQHHVLWDAHSPSTSDAGSNGVPANISFDIELTPDLPHCIHTAGSSLEYTLTATLVPVDATADPISHIVPVHLTRYAPENDCLPAHAEPLGTPHPCSAGPTTFSISHPIVAHVSLARTIYRRSQPIELRVRIPPPSPALVQEKGVRLRSVSAELVRVIRRQSLEDAQTWEEANGVLDEDDSSVRTVLSHSGKGCRFASARDLFLRLWLQPAAPLDGPIPCETVTQSTLAHDVAFHLVVSLALSGREGDRETVTLERRILVLPDHPSAPKSRRSEKQREAGAAFSDVDLLPAPPSPTRPPAPRYVSDPAVPHDGPSTSSGGPSATATTVSEEQPSWSEGEGEDEYDGYEEASVGAELRPGPPTIDADRSPPSLEDDEDEDDDRGSAGGGGVSTPGSGIQPASTMPLAVPEPVPPSELSPVGPGEGEGEAEAPPDYATGTSAQPPAYSAETRADEVEVVPSAAGRRLLHGVV